ncbi:MAG: hypothetical protein AXA67_11995 [Methylothermaceae bacteria B42]|nr:MAG: hypothetical protein AXA67_11995 [Methylothermaceae bacteria B42]HHJ39252.1 hypothetical protein [Methylothermaceae bacterium]
MSSEDLINYDEMLFLDAEDLAEQGIARAYEEIKAEFQKRGIDLSPIEEIIDNENGTYHVNYGGKTYCIYADIDDKDSWANATVALFDIVNSQLQESDIRLYAINGGNDLVGVILTENEYAKARDQLENKTDWPYLPKQGDEWVGQPH